MDVPTIIPFTLTNTVNSVQTAVLLGGSARAASLVGRVLTDDQFLAESGNNVITVTGTTSPTALKTLQDFGQYLQAQVMQIKVKSTSYKQASTHFQQKTYVVPGPDLWADIPAKRDMGEQTDEGKVIYLFDRPFYVSPYQSLLMVLQPSVVVNVELFVFFGRTGI